MTNLQRIGRRIAELRDAKGETQADLAAAVGVARSTIAGIERGIDGGGILTVVAIADHLKVPMDWLLGRKIPAGGPHLGQFVDDADELAWLNFWRVLDDEGRRAVTRTLQIRDSRHGAA